MASKYAEAFANPKGAGDARPTALQIVKDEEMEGKLAGKNIFITGCSSGIGVETAKALAATGATLYLTARDLDKAAKALGPLVGLDRVHLLRLDLNSLVSVRACAAEFLAGSNGKLNILINNAGVMATPYGKTEEGFETQFGTNHLAHFLLFKLLEPALLASSTPEFNSRVIALSSTGHRMGGGVRFQDLNWEKEDEYSPWSAYGNSKCANIYMANEIDRRYGSKGLHALSVHPGSITTGLQQHVDPAFLASMKENPVRMKLVKSVEQGAATTIWAAIGKEWEGKGGRYLEDCQESRPVSGEYQPFEPGYETFTYNAENEAKLWKISLKLVGLPEDS